MISEIQNPLYQEPTEPRAETSQKMGRDEFLKIFLAQIQHQDPLNPMEGTEFTAQLAQFGTLEQLFNANQTLESIQGIQDQASDFQALSLMGREVLAEGDQLFLDGTAKASGGFHLDQRAACELVVKDPQGNQVRRIPLGTLDPGRHRFEWDGRNGLGIAMPRGVYSFDVVALDEEGRSVSVKTQIAGVVDRVNMETHPPLIYMGDISVRLDQVLDVRSPQSPEGAEEGREEISDDGPA